MAKKVSTSNKIAIIYLCKKLYNFWFQYKCCKNKVKCLQYCHLTRQDCGNTSIVGEGINVAIILKSKNGENNPQIGPNISILPCF